jgi:hypothetical protein
VTPMRMILGLDGVTRGPMLEQARALGAAVLISANSLAQRGPDGSGGQRFVGFRTTALPLLDGIEAYLDSAGFVAMVRYGGYEWAVRQYVALAAAYRWVWFASMDACVEPEVAPNRDLVQQRIAWTVALYRECRREAEAQGCADRLLPVIQGARPEDYTRCLDMMPGAAERPLIGVGSMCRRATGGPEGVVASVDAIDRQLGPDPTRLHLFGVKSDAAEALRGHPRIASVDSQAYGVRARSQALETNRARAAQADLLGEQPPVSKSRHYIAGFMGRWYGKQTARLARPGDAPGATGALALPPPPAPPVSVWEARLREALAEMLDLLAGGEMEWSDITPTSVAAWAYDAAN